jgi:hypothetical protein
MICVYFLLLSRRGAMIESGENSFPSEPEAIVVYRGSSNSRRRAPRASQCASRSCDVWLSIGFVPGPMVDPPAQEDGFELAVPPRRERLWAATPGKHCRFGPEPVSGSAFHAPVSDWQAQKSLSQERYRWFESGSLQQTVRLSPDFALVPGKARVLRRYGGEARQYGRQRPAKSSNIALRSGNVSVGRYFSTAVSPMRFAPMGAPPPSAGCALEIQRYR